MLILSVVKGIWNKNGNRIGSLTYAFSFYAYGEISSTIAFEETNSVLSNSVTNNFALIFFS